jgi:hypothetical protein
LSIVSFNCLLCTFSFRLLMTFMGSTTLTNLWIFFLQCCHEETSEHGDACVLPKHCLSNLRCIWFIIYVVIFWLHIVFIFVLFFASKVEHNELWNV